MKIVSYQDLKVWQRAMELVIATYDLTKKLPADEQYGLISQMRRAAVSIPSNIAEGKMRGTRKDYRNFLITALASGAELETQLEIVKRLAIANQEAVIPASSLLQEVMKMLTVLVYKLQSSSSRNLQPNHLQPSNLKPLPHV